MLVLRSLLFNALFYLNLILQMILWAPLLYLLPRKTAWFIPKFWVRTSFWLQERIVGTRINIDGLDNLPEGPFILAPKHQSLWDAIAFLSYVRDPLYILKRELVWIPLFGLYIKRMRLIPVNRGSRSKALRKVIIDTQREIADDRQLIIYPEGTRRPPGAEPAYKYGIAELYSRLNLPVVPVAHNAGLFWPRRKFLRYPGTLKVRFLPSIAPGLDREAFMSRLISDTENECDVLLADAARQPGHPPLPESARQRLRDLGVPTA